MRTAMESYRARRPWQEDIFSEVDKIIARDTRRAERNLKKFLAELKNDQIDHAKA